MIRQIMLVFSDDTTIEEAYKEAFFKFRSSIDAEVIAVLRGFEFLVAPEVPFSEVKQAFDEHVKEEVKA